MTRHRRTITWLVAIAVQILAPAPGVSAEPWGRAHVDALPDAAFAVVHVRPDGTRSRHLPHHDAEGRIDLPHLMSALGHLGQVHWEDPADAERARRHLRGHQEALGIRRARGRPAASRR